MKKGVFLLFLVLMFNSLSAQLTTVASNLEFPTAIALHGKNLYMAETVANKISRIDITERNPTPVDVVTSLNDPFSLAFHGDDLYVAERDGNQILKINVTSANPVAVTVVRNLSEPISLAFKGDELYIGEDGANKISKINVTQANPIVSDVIATNSPSAMVFNGDDLYVAHGVLSNVSKINTSGTPTQISFLEIPLALAFKANELYFGEGGKVSKVNVNSLASERVTAMFGSPSSMVFDGDDLYISVASQGDGRIYKLSTPSLSSDSFLAKNKMKIYPNPATSFIKVDGLLKKQEYTIYNALGSEVQKSIINSNAQIEIKELNGGIYFLKLENGIPFKFIKK